MIIILLLVVTDYIKQFWYFVTLFLNLYLYNSSRHGILSMDNHIMYNLFIINNYRLTPKCTDSRYIVLIDFNACICVAMRLYTFRNIVIN